MANKIQLRRGLKSSMPTGSAGEPLYATDTRELFMGTGSGNVNMGGSHWYRGTAMSGTSSSSNAYSYSACPDVKLDDIYMNTSNGNIYACTTAGKGSAAKWTYQGCIKGAQGIQGAKGDTGNTGATVIWHTGTAMSGTGTKNVTVSDAKAGDMYLNTSTCDVYKASSASSWTRVCNIKGATGATGATGAAASDKNIYTAIMMFAAALTKNNQFNKSEIVEFLGDCVCNEKVGKNATIDSDACLHITDSASEMLGYVYIHPQTKGYSFIKDDFGVYYNFTGAVESGKAAIFDLNYANGENNLILSA